VNRPLLFRTTLFRITKIQRIKEIVRRVGQEHGQIDPQTPDTIVEDIGNFGKELCGALFCVIVKYSNKDV